MSKISFDLNKQVTQDLPVKPIEQYNKNVVGQFVKIELTKKVSEAKTGYQYAGFEVPTLEFTFKQKIDVFNKEDRYLRFSFRPVVTKKNVGLEMAADTVDNLTQALYGHLKHIHEAFEGTANFKPLKKLTAIEQSYDAQTMLDAFEKFFKEWLDVFNGKDGNGCYVDIDLAFKAIVNKGERRIDIPKYVNKGYVKVAKFDTKGHLTNPVEFFGESVVIPEAITADAAAGTTAAPTGNVDLNDIDL